MGSILKSKWWRQHGSTIEIAGDQQGIQKDRLNSSSHKGRNEFKKKALWYHDTLNDPELCENHVAGSLSALEERERETCDLVRNSFYSHWPNLVFIFYPPKSIDSISLSFFFFKKNIYNE